MVHASRTIKVNADPDKPKLTRDLVWRGLVMKAENPLPFVPVITKCTIRERGENRLVREIDDKGDTIVENVTFHPQRPIEEIPAVLAGSDALLVSLSGHPTFEQFVPSKMIDFMAVGRPVILAAAGEAVRVLERSGGGIAVAPEDPAALAEAVRWLASHPREAAEMGRRGREFAATRLRSTQAERLEQLMLDVVR